MMYSYCGDGGIAAAVVRILFMSRSNLFFDDRPAHHFDLYECFQVYGIVRTLTKAAQIWRVSVRLDLLVRDRYGEMP